MLSEELRKFRLIEGHIGFGLHEFIPQPSTYITLLRNPVKRIISYYNYVKSHPSHYLHETVTLHNMSLKDFVNSQLSIELDNLQTRMISGNHLIEFGTCSSSMLNQAKENIKNYFLMVGTTERFNEFLLLAIKKLGWRQVFYIRQNVTPKKYSNSQVDQRIIDTIANSQSLDIELYQYVDDIFNERLKEIEQLDIHLAAFERENHKYRLYLKSLSYLKKISAKFIQLLPVHK